ncbi:MAG: hypothetical protein KDK07_09850 [Bauldia sp.]|nr:hypothetical protein [Bauldia sp.]
MVSPLGYGLCAQAQVEVMEDFRSILERHPRLELDIRRLRARDASFTAVCRDYEEAMSALRHWRDVAREVDTKIQDYVSFLAELEDEILAQLNRSLPATQRS